MSESPRRQRLRRVLGIVALLLLAYTLIGWLLGERLSRRQRVVDGLGPVEAGVWEGAMRFSWVEIGSLPSPFGHESESAPAFAPGSGDLYFSRHHPEAGWELYRARRTPEGYAAPEPLFEVNSPADDTDPCLLDGGRQLVFASNRQGGQGGFDLYGAPVGRDGIGAVRHLAELSSAADDRQPTTDAAGQLLVFASSRLSEDGLRLELYESERGEGSYLPARRLDELEVPAPSEARSPELSADGRFLYYAADVPWGAGGFDLHRAVRHQARWTQPHVLTAFSTVEDELDPALSPGGERMIFARSTPESAGMSTRLHLGERQEVVSIVVPGRAFSQASLLLLVAVLAALCLTYLTLRWRDLHPFTKFLLLSLLVHLVLLLLVDPDSGGARGDSTPRDREFAVEFLGTEQSESEDQPTAATGDQVEAERVASAAPQASAQLDSPETPAAARAEIAHEAMAPRGIQAEAPAAAAAPERSQTGTARVALQEPERSAGSPRKADADIAHAAVAQASPAGESGRQPSEVRAARRPQVGEASAPPTTAQAGLVAGRHGVAALLSEAAAEVAVVSIGRRARAPPVGAGPAPAMANQGEPRKASPGEVTATAVAGPAGMAVGTAPGSVAASLLAAGPTMASAGAPAGPAGPSAPGYAGRRSTASAALSEESPRAAAFARRGRAPTLARSLARTTGAPSEGVAAADAGPAGREVAGPSATALAQASPGSLGGRPRASGAVLDGGVEAGRPAARLARRSLASGGDAPGRELLAPRRRVRPGRAIPRAGSAGGVRTGSAGAVSASATTRARRTQAQGLTGAPLRPRLDHRSPARPAGQGTGEAELAQARLAPRDLLRRRAVELAPEPGSGALASRRGEAKVEALARGGGTAKTEEAVLAGLRYLRLRQQRSGGWGDDGMHRKYGEVRIGKTGLALLAFLGSGYTHDRPSEFQRTVAGGLAFLLPQQDERTGHLGDGSSYSHGIATYAMAEAYAMTQDPELKRPLELAVKRIVRAQEVGRGLEAGGWGYYYAGRPLHDDGWPRMSASIWQIMALKSASLAGIRVPPASLDAARRFVLGSWDSRLGAIRYNHDPQWRRRGYDTLPGSTSGALFAMQLLDVPRNDHRYEGALDFVVARPPSFPWRRHGNDDMVLRVKGNLYFHYHATLALYRHGGVEWKRWNQLLQRQLLDTQERDGSWLPISAYAEYAGDDRSDRSYTTAMCVLMLEVYYRYLTPLLEDGIARESAPVRTPAAPPRADPLIEILEVRPDSDADRLGVRAGDRILRLSGRTPHTLEELDAALGRISADRPAVLTLRRADRTVHLVLRARLTGVRVRAP